MEQNSVPENSSSKMATAAQPKRKNWLTKKLAIIFILVALPLLAFFIGYWQRNSHANVLSANTKYATLPLMQETQLAPYNGSDDNLPVYIGLNGLVYDVSAGREFYNTNGAYHYLAGKDSSADLNLIGGDIIARKYPVIARLGK